MTSLALVSDDLVLAAQSGDRHALIQLLVVLQPDIRMEAPRVFLCCRERAKPPQNAAQQGNADRRHEDHSGNA